MNLIISNNHKAIKPIIYLSSKKLFFFTVLHEKFSFSRNYFKNYKKLKLLLCALTIISMCFYSSAETTASELYQSEKLIEFGIDGIESFSTQMLPIIEILKGENLSDFNMRSHKPANEKEKKRDEKFIKDTSERVTLAKEMGNKLRSLPKERYTISNYTHENSQKLKYLLIYPEKYDKTKKHPLIVSLHGGGGSKLDDIFSVGGNNLAPAIAACLLQEKHSSFILVPQAEKGLDWGMPSTHFQFDKRKTIKDHSQALIDLINQVHNNYNTDKNRVYLMGQSVGGSGAIYLSVNYPNVFAASVPIFGWSNPVTADKLDHAMWIFTAEYDKMKAGKPRLNFEFFQEARSSGKDIQFTCFGNAGHPSSYLVYLRLQFWDWLFAQERKNERKIEN